MVLAAAKVAMVLADNSGNGGAGNGGENRSTKTQQWSAVVAAVVAAAVAAAATVMAATTAGQIVAAVAMMIARFTLERVCAAPWGTKLATYSDILDIFGVCRFYLHHK
jgi:hypothetical protein